MPHFLKHLAFQIQWGGVQMPYSHGALKSCLCTRVYDAGGFADCESGAGNAATESVPS